MPIELIESVDVLKGLSGFLYGLNSPGGTINYLPKRPILEPLTELSLDTALNHIGSRSVDAQNSGFILGYTVWDAEVSYDTVLGNTPTTFRLYGKNLTDKYYYPSVFFDGGLEIRRGR